MSYWFLILAMVVMSSMQLSAQVAGELQNSDRLEIEKTFSNYNQALIEAYTFTIRNRAVA